jgi:hypothetical protein
MGAVARLKRDLTKHRGKAAVLGILFATMVALSVRAFLELRPTAAAAANVPAVEPANSLSSRGGTGLDADQRIRESQELWLRLKEVKATAAGSQLAFTFDADSYPPPAPLPEARTAPTPEVPVVTPAPGASGAEAAARANRIREQARSLVIKSTAVGNGAMEPMAIINQQLLTVGQKIQGFEISAIRAREVEFVKDGVTTVVRMPDGQ